MPNRAGAIVDSESRPVQNLAVRFGSRELRDGLFAQVADQIVDEARSLRPISVSIDAIGAAKAFDERGDIDPPRAKDDDEARSEMQALRGAILILGWHSLVHRPAGDVLDEASRPLRDFSRASPDRSTPGI